MERTKYAHEVEFPSMSPLALHGLNTFLDFDREERDTGSNDLVLIYFPIEVVEVSERAVQVWAKARTLLNSAFNGLYTEGGEEVRRVNALEIAWLYIIDDLLTVGCSPEFVVKGVAEAFEQAIIWPDHERQELLLYELIEVYLWLALRHHIATVFLAFQEGGTAWLSLDEYVALWDIHKQIPPNHFVISLNRIGQRLVDHAFISEYDPTPQDSAVVPVSAEERQVIETLRENNYQKLTIHRKEGKIESLEGEETIPVSAGRVTDLLTDNPFQDIRLKTSDGKLVHIERTVKKRLR